MLRRCGELYREGGIRELSRGIRDYIEHDLGSNYQDRRTDNQIRWEFIELHIEKKDQSLIDIGCAEGEFAAKAAEMNLDVTGFDRNVTRLHTARSKHSEHDNLQFKRVDFTPETLDELPEADVTLFLTVHHHWVEAYGWDTAEEMFQTLLEKTNTLVYEPPGNIAIRESTVKGSLDPEQSINYYTEILESSFGDNIQIRDVMMAEYKQGAGRRDPIFIIDSSNY